MTLWVLNNTLERSRIGLRAPRRVGTAVLRNRLRRRVREAFRRNRDRIPVGVDLMCQLRTAEGCSYAVLAESLIRLSVKAARRRPGDRPRRSRSADP
ncbi:MAG: hypothetical protein AMXMBFR22_24890 [Phycisphaerae bacterium]